MLCAVLAVIATVTCLSLICWAKVLLSVNGETEITLEVFSSYEEPGVSAEYINPLFGYKKALTIEIEGQVDTTKTGTYELIYTAKRGGKQGSGKRTVTVVDTTSPLIDVEDYTVSLPIEKTPATVEDITIEFSATDNYDGDLTDQVVKTVEDNRLLLSVTDSSGNSASQEIRITYYDDVSPVIRLSGNKTLYVKSGTPFVDPGYTATDNLDGDLTGKVTVSGLPNMDHSGNYAVTYSVSDEAGNTAYATRKVVVYGAAGDSPYQTVVPNGKTIYLTFDDGPGQFTAELLDILASYNVKATFFVTNQFPGYQSLIAREHGEGHAVGVHTLTHQFSIYTSIESYMADFHAMHDIIGQQAGIDTKIFRFPGGTNNTRSKDFSIGIMTALNEKMAADGYVEFDWNVDCGDTSRNANSSTVADNVIKAIAKHDASVVLMHDIKRHTVDAIPAIIEYGLSHGYTFETLNTGSPRVQFKPNN